MAIGKVLTGTYGLIAEFNDPQELLDAANAASEAGYTELDAFSPFPSTDCTRRWGCIAPSCR
jgi:hypothetical protein